MKNVRLKKISELINLHVICRQDELLSRLAAEGIICTQATLSRDLAELGVRKIREDGVLRYAVGRQGAPSVFTAGIRSVRLAGNIAVIACSPGTAAAVCIQIDNMNINEVVGTIAGDDTIFAACDSPESAKRFTARLKTLVGNI